MRYQSLGDHQCQGSCGSPGQVALLAERVVQTSDWSLGVSQVFAGTHLVVLLCDDRSVRVLGLLQLDRGLEKTPAAAESELIKVATDTHVTAVSVGEYHVLYISLGRVFSVGKNEYGELGIGQRCCLSLTAHQVHLPHGEGVRAVAAGCRFSIVLTEGAAVYVFGSGAFHRLGLGSATTDSLSPARLDLLDGVGQLRGDGSSSGVSLIAAGKWHAVAVAGEASDVYLWGWCKFGQSGLKEETLVSSPTRLAALDPLLRAEERILKVVCGSRFTALLTSLGEVFIL